MNNTQTHDQELSLSNQHYGRHVQPRNFSLPLSGGRGSVPAAARPNDGIGSSDSGSAGVGNVGGHELRSVLHSHLRLDALPQEMRQGPLGRGLATHGGVWRPNNGGGAHAGLPQQSAAYGLGRTDATVDTRSAGESLGNERGQGGNDWHDTGGSDGPLGSADQTGSAAGGLRNDLRDESDVRDNAHNLNTANRRTRRRQDAKERRTAVRIASLNMNGFGRLQAGHPENKWGNIYRVMKEQCIAVLLLQETHMTAERMITVERMTAHNLKVFYSPHPVYPTAREGVAVVLNKKLLSIRGTKARTIVPGRALQVSMPWHGTELLHILCIYAPTSEGEAVRREFYDEVSEYYNSHPNVPRPTLMAGDFNNVEDTIDRMPLSSGADSSVEALDGLKLTLNLMMADGWRMTHPTEREFTFRRGETFARLDRIYVKENTFRQARNWRIHEGLVRSDHNVVSMELMCNTGPEIGKGRPVFSAYLLQDKKTTAFLRERGLRAMREIAALNAEGTRDELNNPQTILASMKADWLVFAREREKQMVPKLLAEIRDLEAELKEIKTNAVLPDEVKAPSMAALAGQIRKLHEKRLNQLKASGRAKHRIDGERPTKYWTKLHREKKPREVMMAFEKEGLQRRGDLRPTYETNSKKMAEMARDYHDNLQKDSLEEERLSPNREAAIVSALDAIKARVSEDQAEQLGQELTWDECEIALRFSKSGSAPGLDGLPYDLWKTLHARFVEDSRHDDRTPFDVLMLLMSVLRDVKRYGVCETACFADGWMCPIYKEKGERTKIANYRPITLLNTDYKLLTKVLAIRLAEVAPDIVHPSQAGFVPGRRLHNHTQLAKLMIDWAERTEQNGAIIALDQEKAYDKVAHDYLWRVLERFGLPIAFVDCFRKLYTNAKTSVMINGVLSSPFKVYRGVRQGDPISCLLFDLAIEPLSAMIRDSDIVGFQIPGTMEKLKATLFADDTTVYLSEDDDFGVLQGILDKWCLAAKARFNIKKTEVIPIGTPEYRKNMVDTYRVTGQWRNYPQNVRMASDGNVVRMLGAFMGNDAEAASVWSTTLAKVALAIERWKMGISTIEGRRHVVQMIIGGMTQFLTDVQLMPPSVCKRLEGMISQYFWNDRARPPIKMKYIQTPFESGGLKVLDLEARNEAIQVMWLKSYLDFSTSRPLWAFIADDIFARTVTKDCSVKVRELRRNPFLQDWRPKLAELPDTLREMFKIGVKYGI